MRKVIFAIILLGFFSCSNPLDRAYNPETIQEDLEIIVARDKVDKSDLANLAHYLHVCAMEGIDLAGATYGELIKAANEWEKSDSFDFK